jgi:flagellum-specific peptidoglycan hydrolase FlgJ
MNSLANDQDRLRRWGFLKDKSSGYGPNTAAAYDLALDELEKYLPLPAPPPMPVSFNHKQLADRTILAAQAAERQYPTVPSAISLAQFALESAWGKKDLGVHNYGGIKLSKAERNNGKPIVPFVVKRTREVVDGKDIYIDDYFRAFDSVEDYFLHHAKLLATGKYMARAVAQLPSLGKFADELGGGTKTRPAYATDPNYGKSIRALLKGNDLMRFNLGKFVI